MPNYAEINHASAELSAELGMLNFGRIFGNAEMLCLTYPSISSIKSQSSKPFGPLCP